MIATEIYKGQGFGNQLWCYVVTRVIARDRGFDFGIKSKGNFKCADFFNLDYGLEVPGGIRGIDGDKPIKLPDNFKYYYKEKKSVHPITKVDIRIHDDNLFKINDWTIVDGIMQDEQYIIHRKDEIRKWLKVKPEFECYDYCSDDICVINFRGGEYTSIKNVFLTQKYWGDAINYMLNNVNKNFKFVVITDDVDTAKKFFPIYDVLHFSVGKDYVIIKNAKYLILSNSSFAFFPAWLNENLKLCIAPKYWSQHNVSDGYWGCGYNITSGWLYLDREGKFYDYDKCLEELNTYTKKHKYFYNDDILSKTKIFVLKVRNKIKNKIAPPKNPRKYLRKYDNFLKKFTSINKEFNKALIKKSDINEHLIALRDISMDCKHITEMGVRGIVSTWAFLEGLRLSGGGKLISIDICDPELSGADLKLVINLAKKEKLDFKFIKADTLNIEIEETDLLFLDTLHQYRQVSGELKLHASKARKYIAFHDTESFGHRGDDGGEGIWKAIQEFLDNNKNWKIRNRFTHNNGVTILEKIS